MTMAFKGTVLTVLMAGAALAAAWSLAPARAATPKDVLVMAMNTNDVITLDPAEVFEFTAADVIANIYDRVMMFEPEDVTTLVGGVAPIFGNFSNWKLNPRPASEAMTYPKARFKTDHGRRHVLDHFREILDQVQGQTVRQGLTRNFGERDADAAEISPILEPGADPITGPRI